MAYNALCLWCLGFKDQARTQSQQAIALARELNHPFTLVDALCYAGCWLSAMEHDAENLFIYAEQLMEISLDNKFAGWSGSAIYFFGEALVRKGQIEEGISQISAGIANELSIYVRCTVVGAYRSLAEAQHDAGRFEEGLGTIHEAFDLIRKTGELFWEAEVYRIQALLLLKLDKDREAEKCLLSAIKSAQKQEAKSWELRATIDLARLWINQGKQEDARHALTEIYEWFTEGFDSSDLVDAKELLEELS